MIEDLVPVYPLMCSLSAQALRERIAEKLGREDVPDSCWDILEFRGHVEEALTLGDHGDKDLIDAARALLGYADFMEGVPSRPKKKKASLDQYRFELSGEEEARARAIGERLALSGTLDLPVQRFRREVLADQLLTSDQAFALVGSPAASRFSRDWFERWRVPVVGHTATWVTGSTVYHERKDRHYEWDAIIVDPPGRDFISWVPDPYHSYDKLPCLELLADLRGRSSRTLDDCFRAVAVYPGSILGDLREVSRTLAEESGRRWREGQAAWFVLTGEPVAPIVLAGEVAAGDDQPYGTITLKVEPWIPAETVFKVYRDLQLGALERNPHAPSSRNLAVFGFVVRRWRENLVSVGRGQKKVPEKPPWRELMEAWNRSNPDSAYNNYKNFHRDFYRAADALRDSLPDFGLLSLLRTIPDVNGPRGDG
jgi:hypothetical protein